MKRREWRIAIIIWVILVTATRSVYLLLNWNVITDYYGYYEQAMIKAEESIPNLSSGLSFAFTNTLSKLLFLCGNHIEAVAVFQGVLQVLALYFFLLAMHFLCGEIPALVSATVLAAIPSLLMATGNVEPVSFYLFHFDLLLLMIGFFYSFSNKQGWRRSSISELFLIVMGLYLGTICIWNYTGFVLLLLLVGVLIRTHLSTKELLLKQNGELFEEKDQAMSTFVQALIVLSGTALGMLITLLKYTGLSGEMISGQLLWWINQFRDFPGTCQGLRLKYAICIAFAILLGFLFNLILNLNHVKKSKEKNIHSEISNEEAAAEQTITCQEDEESFITTDGREVKYLKNPLPEPKKHVARYMDFDLDIDEDDIRKFDQEIN